jgi:hypothetical protein
LAPETLREILLRRPFEPVRLCLTDGTTYEVRHPDLMMVGRRSVIIGLIKGLPTEPRPVYDRFTTVDPLHIVRIEPLDGTGVATSSQAN